MVNTKKLGLAGLVLLGIAKLVNGASDGVIEIKNNTSANISKSRVVMRDNYNDTLYIDPPPGPALISYIYDPNSPAGPYLSGKGINSQNTNEVKMWFKSRDVPTGIDHSLKIRIFSMGGLPADMNDYATRNLTLYQEPNNPDDPNVDPNLYDILDLTDWGTQDGWINLSNISCDPNFNSSQWIFRSDNYADITGVENGLPDGKVDKRDLAKLFSYWANTSCDPNNHWCDFADLDRDGDVDFRDFSRMSLEWLYDTNDPNTW